MDGRRNGVCGSYNKDGKQMKVLVLYDKGGPAYHRCLLPCYLMPGVEISVSRDLTEDACEGVDIVFFNRLVMNTRIMDVEALRDKYGFKIVVDFDDHWELGPDHPLYPMYHYTGINQFMIEYMKLADAVTVTHERLKAEASKYSDKVHVLPNAIPRWGQFDIVKTTSDVTRLFWAGGNTHAKDIEILRNPVKRFSSLPVKMVMAGYNESPEMKRIASAFTNGGKLSNELFNFTPVDEYYSAYAYCDVALIPLVANKFNAHKSNLKILEAANIGANVVVSNVHPYKDIPGVLYVNEQGDWYRHVKFLLDNPAEAERLRAELQDYCKREFDFETINGKRKQLFEALCNPKTEENLKSTAGSMTHGLMTV